MIRVTLTHRPSRILCCDTESKPQAFWYQDKTTAIITAFAWKWRDEKKVHTLLLQADETFVHDAKESVDAASAYLIFRGAMCDADLVYAHNLRGHDLPIINAGLLRHELEPLPELRTTDTLRDYPKRKDMSASLENLAKLYGLDEKGKLHLSVADWEQANNLSTDGIALARKRVTSDVLLQERLRDKLLDLNLLGPPRTWRPR